MARSLLYPTDWQQGYEYQGRKLLDYSFAGYDLGNSAFPEPEIFCFLAAPPYNADPTGKGDCTNIIAQALIDANAYVLSMDVPRPVVIYLGSSLGVGGVFRFNRRSATQTITLSNPYVGLMGAGTNETFIIYDPYRISNNTFDLKSCSLINGGGGNWFSQADATEYVVQSDIAYGANSIELADVTDFSIGEYIVIYADMTDALVAELGATAYWNATNGYPEGQRYIRKITDINNATGMIYFDGAITMPVKTRDNAKVRRHTSNPVLRHIYLGDFSMGACIPNFPYGTDDTTIVGDNLAYQTSGHNMVNLVNARNCVFRNIDTFIINQSMNSRQTANMNYPVRIPSGGFTLTTGFMCEIDNVNIALPANLGEDGNGYGITFSGASCLIKNCTLDSSRHNLSMSQTRTTGNVIYNNIFRNGRFAVDYHRFPTSGNLIDSCRLVNDAIENMDRKFSGSNPPHGITGAYNIIWNVICEQVGTATAIMVKSQQALDGFIIGTTGQGKLVGGVNDFWEESFVGNGQLLEPQSLYLDQLQRRLSN